MSVASASTVTITAAHQKVQWTKDGYHITAGKFRLDCITVQKVHDGSTQVFQEFTLNGKRVHVMGDSPLSPKVRPTGKEKEPVSPSFDLNFSNIESETAATVTFIPSENTVFDTIFSEMLDSESYPLPEVDFQKDLPVEAYTNPYLIALALRYASDKKGTLYQAYKDRAMAFITSFYSRNVGTPKELYQQLTVLVLSNDAEVGSEVLKLLLQEFEKPLLDLKVLKAIGDVFEAGQMDLEKPSVFTDSQRIETLQILYVKCQKVLKECPSRKEIQLFQKTMAKTLVAMADPMREKGKKLDFKFFTELTTLFEGLEKQYSEDETILAGVMSAKQALLILQKDRTENQIILFRVLFATKAFLLLCKSVKNQDLLLLPEVCTSFLQAIHSQPHAGAWYPLHILLQGYIQLDRWDLFVSFMHNKEIGKLKDKEKIHLLQHLLLTLGMVVERSRSLDKVLKGHNTTAYTQAFASFGQLFLKPKNSYWQHFANIFNDFAKQHESELVDLLKVILRCARSDNENIKDSARNLVENLMTKSESIISKELLKKAGFPDSFKEIVSTESEKALVVVHSTAVWEASKPKHEGIYAKIQNGIARYLKDQEMNYALRIAVPSRGANKKAHFPDRYSIVDYAVAKALNLSTPEKLDKSGKKERDVFAIVAERMKGKTLTSMQTTRELGKTWLSSFKPTEKPKFPFPLRITFSSIVDANPLTIGQILQGYPYYLEPQEVQEFISEGIPMSVVGDSLDEMPTMYNSYKTLRLDQWNVVLTILTTRPLLMSQADMNALCSPVDLINNTPQVQRLDATHIAPFEESDFWAVIANYVKNVPSDEKFAVWTDDMYKAVLAKKMNLVKKALVEPSFALVVATALPQIMSKKENADDEVSELEIMMEFRLFCITRATGRIFNSKSEENQQEVKARGGITGISTALERGNENFAARMCAAKTRAVKYAKRLQGERPHRWEKELGNLVIQQGMTVINTQENGVEFYPPNMHDLELFLQMSTAIEQKLHEDDLGIISNLFTVKLEEGFPDALMFFAQHLKAKPKFAAVLDSFLEPDFETTIQEFVKLKTEESAKLKAEKGIGKLSEDEDPAMMKPAVVHVSKMSKKVGDANIIKIKELSLSAVPATVSIIHDDGSDVWV